MMPFRVYSPSVSPLIKSETPTITRPVITARTPSHWKYLNLRPRKATERRPVKIMTAPVNTNILYKKTEWSKRARVKKKFSL